MKLEWIHLYFSIMDKKEKELFSLSVYDIVRMIPEGRATSYGAIAKAVGYPKLSRMVGKIMSECNSKETLIPAHRVVNNQGVLSAKNAFGSQGEMQRLLENEGVTVINDRIRNWSTVFWDPLDEVHL